MLCLLLSALLAAQTFLYSDPEADRLIRQSMQSSYSLRLSDARAAARALESRYPDHPVGYTLMAETYWWEAQMDPDNESIQDTYDQIQKSAVEKGEAALKAGKYPALEITAYLASAHGSRARFLVTQKGAYFGALREGLKAHKYAEEVYAMDHSYYDIYVGIGAFNYFTGSVPAVIKPFAWLIGARGNRELGIEQLKTAMAKARYSQTEARIVYYTAMLEDKNWPEAFAVLQKLRTDYPDNVVLYGWVTEWYREQSKNAAGAEYFEKVFNEESARSPIDAKYALLEKAGLEAADKRIDDSRRSLERLKAMPGSDPLITKKVQALEKTLRK